MSQIFKILIPSEPSLGVREQTIFAEIQSAIVQGGYSFWFFKKATVFSDSLPSVELADLTKSLSGEFTATFIAREEEGGEPFDYTLGVKAVERVSEFPDP